MALAREMEVRMTAIGKRQDQLMKGTIDVIA
jgi:hypothetical protein